MFGKSKRSLKNYALQPFLQIKLGMYCLILSILFVVSLGLVLYVNLENLYNVVLELTGVRSEVIPLIESSIAPAKTQLLLLSGIYILLTLLISMLYTHRLVGPTIAFRRHIRAISDGDFKLRTNLRPGDAFSEVADDLNKLSEKLGGSANRSANVPEK
jgi:methyl-accepting chemotaxis protein